MQESVVALPLLAVGLFNLAVQVIRCCQGRDVGRARAVVATEEEMFLLHGDGSDQASASLLGDVGLVDGHGGRT